MFLEYTSFFLQRLLSFLFISVTSISHVLKTGEYGLVGITRKNRLKICHRWIFWYYYLLWKDSTSRRIYWTSRHLYINRKNVSFVYVNTFGVCKTIDISRAILSIVRTESSAIRAKSFILISIFFNLIQ